MADGATLVTSGAGEIKKTFADLGAAAFIAGAVARYWPTIANGADSARVGVRQGIQWSLTAYHRNGVVWARRRALVSGITDFFFLVLAFWILVFLKEHRLDQLHWIHDDPRDEFWLVFFVIPILTYLACAAAVVWTWPVRVHDSDTIALIERRVRHQQAYDQNITEDAILEKIANARVREFGPADRSPLFPFCTSLAADLATIWSILWMATSYYSETRMSLVSDVQTWSTAAFAILSVFVPHARLFILNAVLAEALNMLSAAIGFGVQAGAVGTRGFAGAALPGVGAEEFRLPEIDPKFQTIGRAILACIYPVLFASALLVGFIMTVPLRGILSYSILVLAVTACIYAAMAVYERLWESAGAWLGKTRRLITISVVIAVMSVLALRIGSVVWVTASSDPDVINVADTTSNASSRVSVGVGSTWRRVRGWFNSFVD